MGEANRGGDAPGEVLGTPAKAIRLPRLTLSV
jgi:hypothetical protein